MMHGKINYAPSAYRIIYGVLVDEKRAACLPLGAIS